MRSKNIVIALLSFALTSCQVSNNTSSDYLVQFVDETGYTTTFYEKPKNVAVLFSSYAEIWSCVGGEIKTTVGDSIKRGFVSEGVTLVNEGAGLKIDQEVLLASKPDLVIATADLSAQLKAVETCRDCGINSLALKEESFDDYLKILKLFCDLNDNTESYKTLGLDIKDNIEKIKEKERTDDISYLFIRAGNGFSSTRVRKSSEHFGCQIFDDLGAINLANTLDGMTETLSLESIMLANPDKIMVVPQGDETASIEYMNSVLANDGWSSLDAVKNDEVHYLDKDLFNYKPNMRWDLSYQKAYQILYEE